MRIEIPLYVLQLTIICLLHLEKIDLYLNISLKM
nr:MAG TPA: Smc4, Condensin complex subunit 2, SMC complex, ATPase, chromosome [Caudoviricetes sp.]